MKKIRILKTAFRSIMRNPMRTFLTTLGIVIGIAAVIALMEIGNGAQEILKENISAMGVNSITVRPGTSMHGGVSSGAGAMANLTTKDIDAIKKSCPSVKLVTPVISARGQVIYKGKNWNPFSISGVADNYLEIGNWKLSEGVMFDERQVARGAKVCLIGSTIRRELFGSEDPLGKDIRIQNVLFKVIGVLASKGANMIGMDQDDVILAPWTAVKARLAGAGSTSVSSISSGTTTTNSPSSAYATATSLYPEQTDDNMPPVRFQNVDSIVAWAYTPELVDSATEEIAKILRKNHKLANDADDDFQIRTMAEFSTFLTSQTETMTKLLLCVAFVSLIVGGVGIMNIMLVSVTERTREIGLRMAVGAKKKDILRQFLVESVVICLLGGIIGIAFGHGATLVLAFLLNWPSAVSYPALLLSVGVSVLVGVLFGYYPAWKAARLDPIEALRYE